MIPDRFKERYSNIVDDPDAFFSILQTLLPKSFRVNTLKSNYAEVMSRFSQYGISLQQMSWYRDAFVSENPEIGGTLEHFRGGIYIQELVSMLPALLVESELKNANYVLDGCAAPGSKTTHLAALMENRGTLVANDIDFGRIRALKFNIEKTGAVNTIITNRDLRAFPEMQFDVVVLDAPCSAEGTMRKNGELFSVWSEAEIERQSKLQKQLIIKAFDMLVPGGSMVYSTCTFAPEENEAVVDWLIQNREATLEPISFEGFRMSKPLEEWNKIKFADQVKNCARIWPHHNDTGGFFLAKVKK